MPPDSAVISDPPAAPAAGAPSPGTTPAGTSQGPAPASGSPPAAGSGSWWPAEHKALMEANGWDKFKDATEFVPHLLDNHVNLRKLVSGDPKRVLQEPAAGDVEAWGKFYNRLGRPEAPEKYTPVEALKDDPLAKQMAPIAHELGLTDKQWTGLQAKLLDVTLGMNEKQNADMATQDAAHTKLRMDALTNSQGAQMAAFTEDARRAMRTAVPETHKDPATGKEWSREEINKAIQDAIGADLQLTIFSTLGKFQAEDRSERGLTPASGIESIEQARARMDQLRIDPEWNKRRLEGGMMSAEQKEFERLTLILASTRAA
jgi:hypothetical protein